MKRLIMVAAMFFAASASMAQQASRPGDGGPLCEQRRSRAAEIPAGRPPPGRTAGSSEKGAAERRQHQGRSTTRPGNMAPNHGRPRTPGLWKLVMQKMKQGGKVVGSTLFSATDPETYSARWRTPDTTSSGPRCSTIPRDWRQVAADVGALRRTPRRCRASVSSGTDEREIQRAVLDAAALVLVRPSTIDPPWKKPFTARATRPSAHRSASAAPAAAEQAFEPDVWCAEAPVRMIARPPITISS